MNQPAINYAWACRILQEAVEKSWYGNITFAIHNGVISAAKREESMKPPVDNNTVKP